MDGTYAASWLPWILIPTITWLMPVVLMSLLFVYIESDA
ncbi:MAG: photosystem I reaction center subunit VIII [Tildeniella torsiva UHER 1998/13D]|nr:photosystem I reaction center subunit VIII [Tildeniella torsiva UHER 1998/13D]